MAVTAEDITKLYQEYLGREPLQSGIDAWLATGQSLVQIAAGISQSPEANVYRTYQQTLGREPEMEERQAWVEQINETGSIQQAVDSIATSPEAKNVSNKNDAITQALTELATSPDTMGLGLNQTLSANKPGPVVQGSDGQYYLSNPQLTTNGWITNPDYSTPVYYFHQPIEVGEARGNYATYSEDYRTATQQGNWFTEDQIKSFWDGTFDTGTLNMDVFREQHPDMTFDQYMSFVSDNSALYGQGLTPESNPEMFSDLTNKYGIKTSFAGETGHVYGWNGSNYTKTFHADKSLDTGGIIMSLAVAAMTGGLANEGLLGSFVQGLSGYQRAAVINGATTALQTGGDLKAIAGSVVGTLAGGQIGSYVDLGSAAANSALSSSISSAFEQAIVNGEIDFETVLSSGVLGGGMAIGEDLLDSLITGSDFDFGGLIDEDTALWETINGQGGFVETFRGNVDEFITKYIEGGEWFTTLDETDEFKDYLTTSDGKIIATRWDGTSVTFANWESFENAVFSTKRLIDNPAWNFIKDNLTGEQASQFYEQVVNWLNNSAGTTNEAGGSVTTTAGTDDSGGGADDDSVDFDCSSVNREQVAGATTGTECGACVDGYEPNEFAECIATIGTTTCPAGQYFNETTLNCEDEVFFTPGQPCNKEDGTQGVFDADGNCVDDNSGTGGTGGKAGDACKVEGTGEDGTLQDDGQGNLTCVATGTGTGGTGGKAGDACTDDVTNQQGTLQDDGQGNLVCVVAGDTSTGGTSTTATQTCSDPNRQTKEDGSCAELCNDGTIPDQHEEGLCGNPLITTTGPKSGTTTTTECTNNATTESDCIKCADGSLASEHEEGNCNNPLTIKTSGGGTTTTGVDCTLVECQSPRPDGEAGVAWDTCCTGDSTVITTGGGGGEEDKCKLVECQSPRPEGDAGALWDQCCKETPVTTIPGGGGGGDGGGMFGGSGLGSFSPAGQPGMFDPTITAGVTLEQARKFPIENFLQQYVAGMNNQNASITSLFEDLV